MYHVVCLSVCLCSVVFVVEFLATQTGGATVNNILEVILVEYLVTIQEVAALSTEL